MKNIFLINLMTCLFLSFAAVSQNKDGTIQIETSTKVKLMLSKKKDYNKNLESLKGFKIQLFYGGEKEAYETKDEFKSLFPEIPIKIIFSSPEWKVQAGNYRTRLEADRFLIEIKKEYPNSIIFMTDIDFEN